MLIHLLCNMHALEQAYAEFQDMIRRGIVPQRTSIMRKAEAMAVMLKNCKDPRELVKYRRPSENAVSIANQLIDDVANVLDRCCSNSP
ncbi:hypothetical protein FEM48_Zijuj07G0002300 [Ziziphus jujuba var. spinosa]|uniref:Pentatricopeptide repeat-containing protein n=1 Tax=Ziziphus jujuba var. spinosa TaxID=714518 RepID=A0A978V1B3_ZIZJJ|nr:hypothetical protein FEM48_Zijuj07G0002300 [Ziziphus jujuba var. spinosa]